MSALFNFQSLLSVILLLICTCTYVRHFSPALLDAHKHGTWEYYSHILLV
ncbi:uncharacterized protein DEA37_0012606, partial [Paragonimus westermani]